MYQEKVNMKILISCTLLIIFLLSTAANIFAAEVKSEIEPVPNPKVKGKTQQILTIESKVTGSQEQPKVLYIMPWQGITNPITIKDKEVQLTMPKFQPINPKMFKKEVRDFAANQAQAQQVLRQKN
jgi:hypothetical protein